MSKYCTYMKIILMVLLQIIKVTAVTVTTSWHIFENLS